MSIGDCMTDFNTALWKEKDENVKHGNFTTNFYDQTCLKLLN